MATCLPPCLPENNGRPWGAGFCRVLARYRALDRISPPAAPIALSAAGGRALGAIGVASNKRIKGGLEALVTPEIPSAISAGELCVDRGCSFRRATGRAPRLLLPRGRPLELSMN
eukprot:9010672-Pyramimonas_sp.AAC.1